jgi:hypothetical protein
MPSSATKDRFTALWLYPVPANSSPKNFAAKIDALADTQLALPVAQANLLKYELVGSTIIRSLTRWHKSCAISPH